MTTITANAAEPVRYANGTIIRIRAPAPAGTLASPESGKTIGIGRSDGGRCRVANGGGAG